MKTLLSHLFLLLLLPAFSALAQEVMPLSESNTNLPPASVPEVVTNTPPSVTTQPKPVIKPKTLSTGASGIALLGSFNGASGGKYSVSGRTLRLPATEGTSHPAGDWRRNLDFGMTQTRGNSDTLRYLLGVDAVKDQEFDLFRFRGKGSYGESDGVKDTENALAGFRYERLLTPKLYALGNIEWMSDTIADLNYRFTGILSPGVRLIRSETMVFNLELGAGYIEENKAGDQNGYTVGRAAATVEHIINEHVLVWCTGEYLPKIADPEIFFVNAEAGIASFITRDLSLNVSYQERYDSAPLEGKKNSDALLSTALSLGF
jgi:putative salt-induced outer membrane protein YdiY